MIFDGEIQGWCKTRVQSRMNSGEKDSGLVCRTKKRMVGGVKNKKRIVVGVPKCPFLVR